jgi:hypothetical protein
MRETFNSFLRMYTKSITHSIKKTQLKIELFFVYKITDLLFDRLNKLEQKHLNFYEINATHVADFTRRALVRRIKELERKTHG